jgi:hypothetical protein
MKNVNRLKQLVLAVTTELVSKCRFCVQISADPEDKTPISCIKYAGNSNPISVNSAACLSCQEYKKTSKPPISI